MVSLMDIPFTIEQITYTLLILGVIGLTSVGIWWIVGKILRGESDEEK